MAPIARAAALWALALAALAAFYALAARHDGFAIRYVGTTFVDARELSFLAYCGALGSVATLAAAAALYQAGGRRLAALGAHLLERPARVALVAAFGAGLTSLWLRHALLLDQPVADDELSYRFIASTLLEGRVINPLPLPAEFLKNQFAVIHERGWYAKYPVGHPALLALGMALGVDALVVPLLAGVGVWLTYRVGCALFDARVAALAGVLLWLSPQYVTTHATQLSQPTSMVCMLLGMLALLGLVSDAGSDPASGRAGGGARWALLCGLALGYGVLARPLPGLLFVAVAIGAYFLDHPRPAFAGQLGARARELAFGGAGLALFALLLLGINALQAGAPLQSGYHEYHAGALGVTSGDVSTRLISLGGAALRQAYWLLGWPLAALLVLLARPRRGRVLLWGMVAAAYAYRLLVPKTVVATTGPVYMLEIVPLLALCVADGLRRLGALLAARGLVRPGAAAAALLAAGTLTAAALFLPVQARAIAGGARERAQAFEELARVREQNPGDADAATVVFAFDNLIVLPARRRTWAYYAPYPAPDLSDHTLFLRAPPEDQGFARVHTLWRTRFPDRRAFILLPSPRGPVVRELAGR